MQSNSKAATAALELEHYLTSQTYGHAAAFALAAELAPPLAEHAEDSPRAPSKGGSMRTCGMRAAKSQRRKWTRVKTDKKNNAVRASHPNRILPA